MCMEQPTTTMSFRLPVALKQQIKTVAKQRKIKHTVLVRLVLARLVADLPPAPAGKEKDDNGYK